MLWWRLRAPFSPGTATPWSHSDEKTIALRRNRINKAGGRGGRPVDTPYGETSARDGHTSTGPFLRTGSAHHTALPIRQWYFNATNRPKGSNWSLGGLGPGGTPTRAGWKFCVKYLRRRSHSIDHV